jgi:hypothetical protein
MKIPGSAPKQLAAALAACKKHKASASRRGEGAAGRGCATAMKIPGSAPKQLAAALAACKKQESMSAARPLFHQKRKSIRNLAMSQKCQKR